MPAARVRADYGSLAQIAKEFGNAASNMRQTLNQLKRQKDVLQGKDWVGKGADKFYDEMDSAVLPMMNRLINGLETAQQQTNQISKIMKQAEVDAAKLLRGDDAGGAPKETGSVVGAVGGVASAAHSAPSGLLDFVGNKLSELGQAIEDAVSGPGETAVKVKDHLQARAKAVQEFIVAGDKQGAIAEAIKQYGIDTKNMTGQPMYNSLLREEAARTRPNGMVDIGEGAFRSPGKLASTIGHEAMHTNQLAEGRWYTDAQGTAINEVECYDWQIANAPHFRLTEDEVEGLKGLRQKYYDTLTDTNKAHVDNKIYTLP